MEGGHDGGHGDHGGHGGHGSLEHGHAFGHLGDLGSVAAVAGHGHSHGHGGHGHLHGHGLGPVGTHGSWAFGSVGQALALAGVLDSAPCSHDSGECSDKVRLPGIISRGLSLQVLVWPHGRVSAQQLFRRIAARHGLQTLSHQVRGLVANCRDNDSILDTKLFDGPGNSSRPSGSFLGATGTTAVWNEYWQQPSRKHWWQSPSLHVGPPLRSHIVVNAYTWWFEQTGDCETRLAITVTDPKTTAAGEWVSFNEESVERHLALAVNIARDFYKELSAVKPHEYSRILRGMMRHSPQTVVSTAEICEPAAPGEHCGPGPRVNSVSRSGEIIANEMQGKV